MSKIKFPKNPYVGIKLFCKTCRVDNPKCNHHDRIMYRVRIHVPGTTNDIKSKMLSDTYGSENVFYETMHGSLPCSETLSRHQISIK